MGVLSESARSPPRNFCVNPIGERGWAQLVGRLVWLVDGYFLGSLGGGLYGCFRGCFQCRAKSFLQLDNSDANANRSLSDRFIKFRYKYTCIYW